MQWVHYQHQYIRRTSKILHSSLDVITHNHTTYFYNNSAYYGNGGAIYGGYRSSLSFRGNNIVFKDNKASQQGGAIYIDSCDTLLDGADIEFEANTAKNGGAIFITTEQRFHWIIPNPFFSFNFSILLSGKFVNNTGEHGGAVYFTYYLRKESPFDQFASPIQIKFELTLANITAVGQLWKCYIYF